jgi:hypothetical protein
MQNLDSSNFNKRRPSHPEHKLRNISKRGKLNSKSSIVNKKYQFYLQNQNSRQMKKYSRHKSQESFSAPLDTLTPKIGSRQFQKHLTQAKRLPVENIEKILNKLTKRVIQESSNLEDSHKTGSQIKKNFTLRENSELSFYRNNARAQKIKMPDQTVTRLNTNFSQESFKNSRLNTKSKVLKGRKSISRKNGKLTTPKKKNIVLKQKKSSENVANSEKTSPIIHAMNIQSKGMKKLTKN